MKKRTEKVLAILLTAAMVWGLAACGGAGGKEAVAEPEKTEETAPAKSNDGAADAAQAEETVPEDAAADVSEGGDDVAAIVAAAVERNNSRVQAQTKWNGPTEGPAAAQDKKIAVIMDDAQNTVSKMWNDSVEEAARLIGWDCTSMDGKGTVAGQMSAMNQAISMKVDGIVIMMDAEAMQEPLESAEKAGIPVVGLHASNVQGADPDRHLFFNITTSGTDIGDAMADYVIADSEGKGRVIIIYDAQFAIAREKVEAMQAKLKTCPTVEILDVVNSPLSEVSSRVPQLTTSWVSTYGTPLYVMSIADYYFDFATTSLRNGGLNAEDVKLLGADGTESAYTRIRDGEYQVVTVPEPATMFGYMAVDALNRGFNEEEPSGFMPSIYLVTPDNIDEEGGQDNIFVPSNNFAQEYAKIWGVAAN